MVAIEPPEIFTFSLIFLLQSVQRTPPSDALKEESRFASTFALQLAQQLI
jgi:hypothetical protein